MEVYEVDYIADADLWDYESELLWHILLLLRIGFWLRLQQHDRWLCRNGLIHLPQYISLFTNYRMDRQAHPTQGRDSLLLRHGYGSWSILPFYTC